MAGVPLLEQEGSRGREEGEGGAGRRGSPGIECFGRRAGDRPTAKRAAAIAAVGRCCVDDEIDGAVRCGRLLEHSSDARLVGDVSLRRPRTRGADGRERLLRASDTGHGPTFRDEQLDHGAAQIARTEHDGAPRRVASVAHVVSIAYEQR